MGFAGVGVGRICIYGVIRGYLAFSCCIIPWLDGVEDIPTLLFTLVAPLQVA